MMLPFGVPDILGPYMVGVQKNGLNVDNLLCALAQGHLNHALTNIVMKPCVHMR